MIGIINYEMGNLGSIVNMFKHVNVGCKIISSNEGFDGCTGLLLPGVGSFDHGMQNLKDSGLLDPLNDLVLSKKLPVLGVCLGMQLMAETSEEGDERGLNWIPGKVKKFVLDDEALRIPHMGWNIARPETEHPLLNGFFDEEVRFYFAHSYYYMCDSSENILMSTDYGGKFASAIYSENIIGVQFHPEKSHKFGMKLMRNFSEFKYPHA